MDICMSTAIGYGIEACPKFGEMVQERYDYYSRLSRDISLECLYSSMIRELEENFKKNAIRVGIYSIPYIGIMFRLGELTRDYFCSYFKEKVFDDFWFIAMSQLPNITKRNVNVLKDQQSILNIHVALERNTQIKDLLFLVNKIILMVLCFFISVSSLYVASLGFCFCAFLSARSFILSEFKIRGIQEEIKNR